MKIIFDTNVWVALFNEKDGHHDAAQRLFLQKGWCLSQNM